MSVPRDQPVCAEASGHRVARSRERRSSTASGPVVARNGSGLRDASDMGTDHTGEDARDPVRPGRKSRLLPPPVERNARGVDMHPNQLTVSVPAVRALVRQQFPQWRKLEIQAIDFPGTVNMLFRIGNDMVARFPLQAATVPATRRRLESEAMAARELLGRTRFATPQPVAIGQPGPGYPLPWSIQTWLPGAVSTGAELTGSPGFAGDLAEFIRGVRAIDVRGRAFSGRGRGGDLRSSDAWMQTCFERSAQLLDVPRLRELWSRFRDLPR